MPPCAAGAAGGNHPPVVAAIAGRRRRDLRAAVGKGGFERMDNETVHRKTKAATLRSVLRTKPPLWLPNLPREAFSVLFRYPHLKAKIKMLLGVASENGK